MKLKGPTGNPGPGLKLTVDTKAVVQEALNKVINDNGHIMGCFKTISGELSIEVLGSRSISDGYLVTFYFHAWEGVSRAIVHMDVSTRGYELKNMVPLYSVRIKDIAFFNSPGKLEPISSAVLAEYINRHLFLIGPEVQLSAKELEHKYTAINGGDHPIHTREIWKKAVNGNFTDDSYWNWVIHEMHTEGMEE